MNVICIRGQTGFQRGDRKAVDLPAGEMRNFGEEVMTQGFGGMLGDPGRHAVGYDIGNECHRRAGDHGAAPENDSRHLFQRNDIVDHIR